MFASKLGILSIFVIVTGYRLFVYVFITNRSYSEGDIYRANGYTFRVNQVYYTDKDYKGQEIENDSSFVIVDLTMQNNASPRTIYLENFHIKNTDNDYVTTRKIYANEFQDLGVAYESEKTCYITNNRNHCVICDIAFRFFSVVCK